MENNLSIGLKCYCCKAEYSASDKFCGKCGYPLQGTQEEQKKFSLNYTLNDFEKDVVKGRIGEARLILFVLAFFTAIYGLIQLFRDSETVLFVVNLILAGIYAGLGFWAKKKAFAAILTGGLIYVSIILLTAFVNPMTLIQGIIFKIIFIVAFIRSTYGAYKYKV